MLPKISSKKLWWITSIGGIIFVAMFIFLITFILPVHNYHAQLVSPVSLANDPVGNQPDQVAKVIATNGTKTSGLPVRLKIPKINLDTNLESVGLTAKGAVDVPKGPTDAAWFNLGPHPGDSGSAVIIGHYGYWKNDTPTVFNNLDKLRPGDKIYVEDDNGAVIVFVVKESRSFDSDADASSVFISTDGRSHLNLITCEGDWNKISQSYSKRLVVFADKE